MTTGNREDYLINILRLTEGEGVAKTTELATYMNVSPASVSEMIKVLAKEGLVNYEKYKGVSLTEEGLTYARQLRKKHHVLERFLTDFSTSTIRPRTRRPAGWSTRSPTNRRSRCAT